MVERLANRLADRIIAENNVSENMKEWYIYSFLHIFETSISTITLLLIGIITDRIIPVGLLCLFFILLRGRTGGFHCDKFWQCYLGTVCSVVVIEIVEMLLRENDVIFYALFAVATITIFCLGTINHPNMNLSKEELSKSKLMARITLLIEASLILITIYVGSERVLLNYMIMAVVLCAIMMLIAKIKKQEVIKYEQ